MVAATVSCEGATPLTGDTVNQLPPLAVAMTTANGRLPLDVARETVCGGGEAWLTAPENARLELLKDIFGSDVTTMVTGIVIEPPTTPVAAIVIEPR